MKPLVPEPRTEANDPTGHAASFTGAVSCPYNEHRPHRALAQRPPLHQPAPAEDRVWADMLELDHVRRRDLLGGLIHEYQLAS
jgi:hypothetical protein